MEELFVGPKVSVQSFELINFRSVVEFAGGVDALAIPIGVAPAANRVEVFQGKAERVHARMAIDAGRIAPMRFEAFADSLPIRENVVWRDGACVARGRWNHPTEDPSKDPVATFDGARAERGGGAGEDCAQAQQAAAMKAVHVLNFRKSVRK